MLHFREGDPNPWPHAGIDQKVQPAQGTVETTATAQSGEISDDAEGNVHLYRGRGTVRSAVQPAVAALKVAVVGDYQYQHLRRLKADISDALDHFSQGGWYLIFRSHVSNSIFSKEDIYPVPYGDET